MILICGWLLFLKDGRTALMITSGNGHTDIVNVLLSLSYIHDINMEDNVKKTTYCYL